SAVSRTAFFVVALMAGWSLSARATVEKVIPSSFAMSKMVVFFKWIRINALAVQVLTQLPCPTKIKIHFGIQKVISTFMPTLALSKNSLPLDHVITRYRYWHILH